MLFIADHVPLARQGEGALVWDPVAPLAACRPPRWPRSLSLSRPRSLSRSLSLRQGTS